MSSYAGFENHAAERALRSRYNGRCTGGAPAGAPEDNHMAAARSFRRRRPWGASWHCDLRELLHRLVLEALRQRREIELLQELLAVGHEVLEVGLDRSAFGLVGLLGVDDHPGLIGD